MFRGNLNYCKGGEDLRPGMNYSAVERQVAEMERTLQIQDIEFETFERCIKRFGYAVALTDDCWSATVAETRVDVSKFKEHGNI